MMMRTAYLLSLLASQFCFSMDVSFRRCNVAKARLYDCTVLYGWLISAANSMLFRIYSQQLLYSVTKERGRLWSRDCVNAAIFV
jgi:hypothetical protein